MAREERIFHLGDKPGAGAQMKVINQLLCGVHLAGSQHTLVHCVDVGNIKDGASPHMRWRSAKGDVHIAAAGAETAERGVGTAVATRHAQRFIKAHRARHVGAEHGDGADAFNAG